MNGLEFLLLLVAAAAMGAVTIAFSPDSAVLGLISFSLLLCILLMWIVALENGGFRRSRGWRDIAIHGLLVTVWSKWRSPIALSISARALLVAAAVALGAIGRLLWVAYA